MTSKKIYERIADALRTNPAAGRAPADWQQLRDDIADVFENDNPRFDRSRFEQACQPNRAARPDAGGPGTITCTLHSAERLNNSVNGNPRFHLHTSEGIYTTQTDAACCYEITNYSNRAPVAVCLKLTRAGRVYGIEPAR